MLNTEPVYSNPMQKSRWSEIAERYRSDIEAGRLGPGDRLPSDAALAELCGVSRVTAHKALAQLRRLGLVVRDGRRGTTVAPQGRVATGRVALVLDQVAHQRDFPRADLLGGLHEGLGEDYSLLWCDSKLSVEREMEFLQRMPKEADGILCWPTGDPRSAAILRELAARDVPLVLLDRVPEGTKANAVISDSVGATRRALEFLMERGHQRIAMLTFDKPHVSTVVERTATYEAVLEERGLSTKGLVRRFPAALEFGEPNGFIQAVYDALFTLVHSPEKATAVYCVQDMFGAAVLDCAAEMGLNVPGDLEVATFNDWPSMMLHRPWQAHRITTRADEIGRVAAARLRELMDGAGGPPRVERIPAELVVADAGLLPLTNVS